VEAKYLKMIQGMKRRGRKDWTVYILRCADGSLYTGIAKDVWARVKQHSEGRGATYTRTRLPVKLLYQKEGLTRSEALVREARIKAMPRSRKEEIISGKDQNTERLKRGRCYEREKQRAQGKQEGAAVEPQREEKAEEGEKE
jgi:predicted GIY-YIG superfamily endonuclease